MLRRRSQSVWLVFVTAMAFARTGSACGADAPRVRVFLLDAGAIARNRDRIRANDPILKPVLDRLREDADRAMEQAPVSVTDNDLVPPSGDKHDYMSFGPYWWPDPTKKDGLPYVRKDGERNPEAGGPKSDAPAFGRMAAAVDSLSLAYFFTGNERYAVQAARLLRTWFLNPGTRMNPHLQYGQAVPGRTDGRAAGLIETARLTGIVDSVGLLAGSKAWTAADQAGMVDWMRCFLDWMRTSKIGRDERAAKNNHGTYYDLQIVTLALFTRQEGLAKRTLEDARERRIGAQVKPDGSQPRELERTRSFSYSAMNLNGLVKLAVLGERQGVDLWRYESPKGGSLRKALDYMAPYTDASKPWPHRQVTTPDRSSLLPALHCAHLKFGGTTYRRAIERLPADRTATDRMWLTVDRARNPEMRLPGRGSRVAPAAGP